MSARRDMYRMFGLGIAWWLVVFIAGTGSLVLFAEAQRLDGFSRAMAGIGCLVLAAIAVFAVVRGRSALHTARGFALRGTRSRTYGRPETLAAAALTSERELSALHQLTGVQSGLDQMKVVCTTPEQIDALAQRLSLRLEPTYAQFAQGEGALIEMAASGNGIAFFAPNRSSHTVVFAWDEGEWEDIRYDLEILSIQEPEWLASPSDFPS